MQRCILETGVGIILERPSLLECSSSRLAADLGTHKGCSYGGFGRLARLGGAGEGTHKGCPYGGLGWGGAFWG